MITAIIGISVVNVFWSGIKLDDRLRWAHDNAMEMLIADQSLAKDLENAVNVNLSSSYPNHPAFKGTEDEISFLTITPRGLRRVTYAGGTVDFGKITKVLIGRSMDRAAGGTFLTEESPVEFLLRSEQSLADWVNGVPAGPPQIIASGIKKDSFACAYAPVSKDIAMQGLKALSYKKEWPGPGLPMAVNCRFFVYDPKNPAREYEYQRNIFLAPVDKHAEQA